VIRQLIRHLRRMIAALTLERFERRTERPLATVAVIFLAAYSVQVLARPTGFWNSAIEIIQWVIWGLFVLDYIARLGLATDRLRWFVRHLFDLAIVVLPILRPLRLLRLVVLVAALQKVIGGAVRGRVVVYTAASAVLLIYAASLAILDTEREHQPDWGIKGFGDAVWWCITTVTTVGYGDLVPVTPKGQVIAVLLMIGGISLVGVVTATLASWIVQRVAQEDSEHQAATAEHIEVLREDARLQMEDLRNEIQQLKEVVLSQQSPLAIHNGHSVGAVSLIRNALIAITFIATIWRLEALALRWTKEKRMRTDAVGVDRPHPQPRQGRGDRA
jgi:voltage-gated potassium channel